MEAGRVYQNLYGMSQFQAWDGRARPGRFWDRTGDARHPGEIASGRLLTLLAGRVPERSLFWVLRLQACQRSFSSMRIPSNVRVSWFSTAWIPSGSI